MTRSFIAWALAIVLVPVVAAGQSQSSALIDQTAANRHGLKRAWFTHVGVGGGRRPIVDMKFDGGTLFVQTGMATTHAIDGATGNTLWRSEVGSPDHPSMPLGVGEKNVAVLNGTTLYVLDRATGQVVFTTRMARTPAAGAAVTAAAVFVPNLAGQLETYSIAETDHRNLSNWRLDGRDLTQPAVSFIGVAWASDRGDFGLATLSGSALTFRIPTNFAFLASPAARGERIYAGNAGGLLYLFDDISGREHWTFAAGSAINQSPVPFADAVYVLCRDQTMFRVSAETGREDWMASGITGFLAASPKHIYAIDRFGRLAVLNPTSGAVVDVMSIGSYAFPITNNQSDQIFLGTETGLIQSLHEIELNKRLDYRAVKPEPAATESADAKTKQKSAKSTKDATTPAAPPAAAPPAAAPPAPAPMPPTVDPFGPAEKPDAQADPFGPAR
jgi:hypothetical protein